MVVVDAHTSGMGCDCERQNCICAHIGISRLNLQTYRHEISKLLCYFLYALTIESDVHTM